MVFAIAEILRKKLKVKTEITRKFVHICAGLISMTFPSIFPNHFFVLVLALGFLLLLLVSRRYGFLNSVNAISRPSYGSIIYPIAIYLCFFVYKQSNDILYYYVPLIIFIISDPVAALVGMQTQWKPYKVYNEKKTVGGSVAFFISAFMLTYGIVYYNITATWYAVGLYSLIIAVVATVTEALSYKGMDNLFIPVSGIITLYFLNI
jgi:phytol kinase